MRPYYSGMPSLEEARARLAGREEHTGLLAIPFRLNRNKGLSFASRLKMQGYKKQRAIYPYFREVAGSSSLT